MTIDRDAEEQRLTLAHKHLAEGKERVSAQLQLLEQLRADGYDPSEGEELLLAFEATLVEMQTHPEHIVDLLRMIDRGEV